MSVTELQVLRCDGKHRKQLAKIATELGLKENVVSRNGLGIVVIPPKEPTILAKVMAKARRERGWPPLRRSE